MTEYQELGAVRDDYVPSLGPTVIYRERSAMMTPSSVILSAPGTWPLQQFNLKLDLGFVLSET